VAIGQTKGLMMRIRYPRAIVTRYDRGQTMGPPNDSATQARVLYAALEELYTANPGEICGFE
jgi:hypothetical protein